MHDEKPYINQLTIRQRGKPIPYGGDGVIRDDGDANYGFVYAKGDDARLASIPELGGDPALMELALAINAPETGLFSVGCVSGQFEDESGHYDAGYIEFAINSKSAIANAQNYFAIFFHFNEFLHNAKFSYRTAFRWELEGVTFLESENARGFTCAIKIATAPLPSREEANQVWQISLDALAHYLRSFSIPATDFLYPQ